MLRFLALGGGETKKERACPCIHFTWYHPRVKIPPPTGWPLTKFTFKHSVLGLGGSRNGIKYFLSPPSEDLTPYLSLLCHEYFLMSQIRIVTFFSGHFGENAKNALHLSIFNTLLNKLEMSQMAFFGSGNLETLTSVNLSIDTLYKRNQSPLKDEHEIKPGAELWGE